MPFIRMNQRKGQHTQLTSTPRDDGRFVPVDPVKLKQFIAENKDKVSSKKIVIDCIECFGGVAVYFNNTRVSGRHRRADGGALIASWSSSLGYIYHLVKGLGL